MLGRVSFEMKTCMVLDLVRLRRQSFGRALGEMRGNLWIVYRLWLGDYEKLRGNLMCLLVFAWACQLCWLGWSVVRWLVCVSCLLDQSQLKIFDKKRGGAMNPLGLHHTILQSH